MTLRELYDERGIKAYPTDKGPHGFLEEYDVLFKSYQKGPVNLLEVGWFMGGASKLFWDYFERCKIRSVEINALSKASTYNPFTSYARDIRVDVMSIHEVTPEYFKDFPVDIAIDDGSHLLEDQLKFAELVWPVLRPGGFMTIEDIQDVPNSIVAFVAAGYEFEVHDLSHKRMDGTISDDVLFYFKKPGEWVPLQ